MITIQGQYITTQYYTNKIPLASLKVFAMSFAEQSSPWYSTTHYPTRWIHLEKDFESMYSKRLKKYLRSDFAAEYTVRRPAIIPDLLSMFESTVQAKKLKPYPSSVLLEQKNYYYSEIHHSTLGRLAAHLCIGDPDQKIALGYINASNYRHFQQPKEARIASIANKMLFDDDLHYLKEQGYFYYDMVGISEPLNQMKKEFGGEIVSTYHHTPKIIVGAHKIKRLIQAY